MLNQELEPKQGGYLIVPLTRQGMVSLMDGSDSGDGDDLLHIPFTAEEAAALMPLMREFERAFGFDSQGGTVEQLIDTRFADVALDLSRAFPERAGTTAAREAGRKMAEALEAALAHGSFVEFALNAS